MIPPPLQAAKWLAVQVLLSSYEMKQLIATLGPFSLFPTQPSMSQNPLPLPFFLEAYAEYIHVLEQGKIPEDALFRIPFSTMWSVDSEAVIVTLLPGQSSKYLFRAVRPVIQLQPHRFSYSSLDGKFRSMALGAETISWGIQFSYPQLFQHHETKEVKKVDDFFSNTALFQALRRWIREHTLPTPFLIGEKVERVPIRIGKECFSWIGSHSQLKKQKLLIRPLA